MNEKDGAKNPDVMWFTKYHNRMLQRFFNNTSPLIPYNISSDCHLQWGWLFIHHCSGQSKEGKVWIQRFKKIQNLRSSHYINSQKCIYLPLSTPISCIHNISICENKTWSLSQHITELQYTLIPSTSQNYSIH